MLRIIPYQNSEQVAHISSTSTNQQVEPIDDRQATVEYYRKLREFLLPEDGQESSFSAAEKLSENVDKTERARSESPPVKTLKNALSTLADYRSVSRSPEHMRTVEITKKR